MKVERKVEIPPRTKGLKYPWDELKVGDSFFVDQKVTSNGMYSCAANYNRRAKKPIKISVRKEGNGIRVWRVK